MEMKLSKFLQPKRRLTRQRSGFNVGGIKTGSECLLSQTKIYRVGSSHLTLLKREENITFTKLFGKDVGIYGAGGYLKINANSEVVIKIELLDDTGAKINAEKAYKVSHDHWARIGNDLQVEVEDVTKTYTATVSIKINASTPSFDLEIHELYADVVKFYAEKPKYFTAFYEKTDLYRPDIYYLNPSEFVFDSDSIQQIKLGCIVSKSCNRCARFLPIDIGDESNSLGFSNHCKKKAPCVHNAFSRYIIENPESLGDCPNELKKSVIESGEKKYLQTNFGFQLECRTCKKFEVNSPLNPLRNKAQHHEDSARRRAFERLIIELTKQDVVKTFRSTNGIEFQEYIWDNFSKTCFGCGKMLEKITDMDIDHTLPLVYLWPLDATATALCKSCNSLKHDLFPSEFKLYDKNKLMVLSKLTGIPYEIISSKERIVNESVSRLLKENVEWVFEDFLSRKDYQKIKKGKKVADLIFKALNKVLSTANIDLLSIYRKKTGKFPSSISLE